MMYMVLPENPFDLLKPEGIRAFFASLTPGDWNTAGLGALFLLIVVALSLVLFIVYARFLRG